jgi:hypothetical protein
MKTLIAISRTGSLLALTVAAALTFTSCAQNLTHPPVYRGQYYAFDVYPYGYNGYPGFPYYGAPFGYGGPAFAATAQYTRQESGKEMRTTRTSVQARHRAHAAARHDRDRSDAAPARRQ